MANSDIQAANGTDVHPFDAVRSGAPISSFSGRVRSASLHAADVSIPTGAWSGLGQSAGKAPSLADIRRGSISRTSIEQTSRPRAGSGVGNTLSESKIGTFTVHESAQDSLGTPDTRTVVKKTTVGPTRRLQPLPNHLGIYPNGYHSPPRKPWREATWLGLKGLLHYICTPLGFIIVVYSCNVVAWGGMLFLLLCNTSPAMCVLGDGRYDCNDINSPRRIWIEIDSQILTGLFCVTAFGLAPWRFRDLWFWTLWRLSHRQSALRTLAGYKKGWFRLKGSEELPDGLGPESDDREWQGIEESFYPKPRRNIPNPPLTGARAQSSAYWKLDFVIWCMVWNTLFQCVLCSLMWGLNRFNRPGWSTGLFVALACVVAGVGGIMELVEGKRVKAIEGVPLDTANALADLESGGRRSQLEGRDLVLTEIQIK